MRKKFILGFSLVELLVVISIICILSVIGIASYINFSRSQTVTQAARKIVQDMRLAQSLAKNNQKPEDCSGRTLYGYLFDGSTLDSQKKYSIYVECVTGSTIDRTLVKSELVSNSLNFSGFNKVEFLILDRGVRFDDLKIIPAITQRTLTVSWTDIGVNRLIIIDEGGSINIQGETPTP